MEKVIGLFNTNRVSRSTGPVGVEMQAVIATKVLGDLISSGLVSGEAVASNIDRTTARFLNNRALMMSLVLSGRDSDHDAAVDATLTAAGFLEAQVSSRRASRMTRITARMKGLFR